MVSYGSVVQEALRVLEQSKKMALINQQILSRKLSGFMRASLFHGLDTHPADRDLSSIFETQIACQQSTELQQLFWDEFENVKIVKAAHERLDCECAFIECQQLPKNVGLHWLDGPASD